MKKGKSETVIESVSSALKAVWWLPLLRGISLVILGVLVTIEPLNTLVTLVWIAGIFLLVDGVFAIIQGWANRTQTGWRMWLVQGLVDVIFAVLILVWPGITVLVFFYLLVVWTIALGAVAIIGSAIAARSKNLSSPWMLAFGLLSVLFGVMLLVRSSGNIVATLQIVGLVLGLYAFIAGALQIVSAFSVRAVARDIDQALRGQSEVLKAINLNQEQYEAERVQRAAEREEDRRTRAAEREKEKQERAAEREAEKLQREAEKEAEKRAAELEHAALENRALEESRKAALAPDLLDEPTQPQRPDTPGAGSPWAGASALDEPSTSPNPTEDEGRPGGRHV